MKLYMDQIKAYLKEQQSNNGSENIHSLLEFLWEAYTYVHPIDSEKIRETLGLLEPVSRALAWDEANLLDDTVCELCVEHGRVAFLEGLHVGARLIAELEMTE